MTPEQLKAVIDADPYSRGYSGMTDAEVAADLNTLRHKSECRKTVLGIAKELGQTAARNLAGSMQAVAAVPDPLMVEMLALLRSGVGIDLAHADTAAVIDSMAANGALPLRVEDATAIKALAEVNQSDADLQGLGTVRVGTVTQARGL